MPENEQAAFFNRIFKRLFFATFAICLPSVVLYFYARLTGSLPTEAAWEKRGGNHGPWWDELQGVLIAFSFLAMLALPCVTFMFALAMSLQSKNQKLLTFSKGLALAAFQFTIGLAVCLPILWTVD